MFLDKILQVNKTLLSLADYTVDDFDHQAAFDALTELDIGLYLAICNLNELDVPDAPNIMMIRLLDYEYVLSELRDLVQFALSDLKTIERASLASCDVD